MYNINIQNLIILASQGGAFQENRITKMYEPHFTRSQIQNTDQKVYDDREWRERAEKIFTSPNNVKSVLITRNFILVKFFTGIKCEDNRRMFVYRYRDEIERLGHEGKCKLSDPIRWLTTPRVYQNIEEIVFESRALSQDNKDRVFAQLRLGISGLDTQKFRRLKAIYLCGNTQGKFKRAEYDSSLKTDLENNGIGTITLFQNNRAIEKPGELVTRPEIYKFDKEVLVQFVNKQKVIRERQIREKEREVNRKKPQIKIKERENKPSQKPDFKKESSGMFDEIMWTGSIKQIDRKIEPQIKTDPITGLNTFMNDKNVEVLSDDAMILDKDRYMNLIKQVPKSVEDLWNRYDVILKEIDKHIPEQKVRKLVIMANRFSVNDRSLFLGGLLGNELSMKDIANMRNTFRKFKNLEYLVVDEEIFGLLQNEYREVYPTSSVFNDLKKLKQFILIDKNNKMHIRDINNMCAITTEDLVLLKRKEFMDRIDVMIWQYMLADEYVRKPFHIRHALEMTKMRLNLGINSSLVAGKHIVDSGIKAGKQSLTDLNVEVKRKREGLGKIIYDIGDIVSGFDNREKSLNKN